MRVNRPACKRFTFFEPSANERLAASAGVRDANAGAATASGTTAAAFCMMARREVAAPSLRAEPLEKARHRQTVRSSDIAR